MKSSIKRVAKLLNARGVPSQLSLFPEDAMRGTLPEPPRPRRLATANGNAVDQDGHRDFKLSKEEAKAVSRSSLGDADDQSTPRLVTDDWTVAKDHDVAVDAPSSGGANAKVKSTEPGESSASAACARSLDAIFDEASTHGQHAELSDATANSIAVGNDGELPTATRRYSSMSLVGREEEPFSSFPKEHQLTTLDYIAHFASAPEHDRDPLRQSVILMNMANFLPCELADCGEAQIEGLIRQYLAGLPEGGMRPASMSSPHRLARAILRAMDRLFRSANGFSCVRLPAVKRVSPEPVATRPAAIAKQIAAWSPEITSSDTDGHTTGIKLERKQDIEVAFWKYVTLCRRASMPIDDRTPLTAITSKDALHAVLPEIKAAYGLRSVPPFLSSIKQILSGTLSAQHPNTLAWLACVQAHRVPEGLTADDVDALRGLTDETATVTVWDISNLIAARARQTERARDREILFACALAVAIALDVPAIKSKELVELNIEQALCGIGESRTLCLEIGGIIQVFPLEQSTLSLHDELISERVLHSEWLFPTNTRTGPRQVGPTMTYLTTTIEAACGKRHTVADLQEGVEAHALDSGAATAREIADVRRNRQVKTVRKRYKLIIDNPLKKRD